MGCKGALVTMRDTKCGLLRVLKLCVDVSGVRSACDSTDYSKLNDKPTKRAPDCIRRASNARRTRKPAYPAHCLGKIIGSRLRAWNDIWLRRGKLPDKN